MTLQELADRIGINPPIPPLHPQYRIVPVSAFGAGSTRDLFNLDDYEVHDYSGGAYWMKLKKGKEA